MFNSINYNNHEYFNELVKECIYFYKNNYDQLNNTNINEKREKLYKYISKYHEEFNLLNNDIKEKLNDLRAKSTIILMTAHQPNLFPYSGVLRKATINFLLEKEIEKQLELPVINIFGIADQDFSDDRWVRTACLPSINRKNGILTLDAKLPSKTLLKNIQKPREETIKKWRYEIERWVNESIKSIKKFLEKNDINLNSKDILLKNNFKIFWNIVEDAEKNTSTYSDFNLYIISKIINEHWKYDTLFFRFSESQKIFVDEFNYLISNFDEYSNSLNEINSLLPENERKLGISLKEKDYLPFWLHCDCGGKASLNLYKQENNIIGKGYCIKCQKIHNMNLGKIHDPDVSQIISNISARAIPMIIIFSKGLGLTCYIGGIGGKIYLKEAQHVAKKLGILLPPIAFWRPMDIYQSTSKMEALLEYKRITGNFEIEELDNNIKILRSKINKINNKIKKLENEKQNLIEKSRNDEISNEEFQHKFNAILNEIKQIKKESNIPILNYDITILKNMPSQKIFPSIIDHAINIGIKEISDQWINFLKTNGSLKSNIHLKSILDDLNSKESYIFQKMLNFIQT